MHCCGEGAVEGAGEGEHTTHDFMSLINPPYSQISNAKKKMATHNSRVILCNISMKLVLLLLAASLWAVCGATNQHDNHDHRRNNNNINKQQMEMERKLLEDSGRSPDPTDHYFCGRGFADASSSCEHPCPSGSLEE